jgi:transcriptional regulator with XRE-family HTH domain
MRRKTPPPPTDEIRERFAANLRACRERLGISQEEVSFRMGVHRTTIGPFELGKKMPRIENVIRLSGVLGVTPNELVAGITWAPGETITSPGGFDVPDYPELAAEVADLRKDDPGRPPGFHVPDDPELAAEVAAARKRASKRKGRPRNG